MEAKERMQIPRQKMPEQDPKARGKNFDEVPFGYSEETAIREAQRCLKCKKPSCVAGCPVEIDIPGFISLIEGGDFIGAARKIKETNALPAVCGRVCPQEEQCEVKCILAKKGDPVAIGRLERFAADYERNAGKVQVPKIAVSTGKKIAVVGSGPAGLTVAGTLRLLGHDVTVFEALHKTGGVLVYGIPEFRLPKAIVEAEVNYLKEMGVKFVTNYVIGKIRTVDTVLSEYDAVFLGTGAGLPLFLGVPGENLNGVYSANEYLTRSNLMKAYLFPKYDTPIVLGKNVAVIGGGNVAMDSARTALRLGADNAYIIYRRSLDEMPARKEEVHHAEEEGIQFHILTNPVAFIGDENNWVREIECQKQELGEPDDSGRRRPVPIKGSEFRIPVDTVVVAIGNSPNPLVPATTPGLDTGRKGNIVANEETGLTSRDGVYAGGDIVTGAATVILAMGAGRKAAQAMHAYVMNGKKE
jgi:glutamate synthase (NADPH/NADH) small chain